jgi:hypothetical protein
LKEAVVKHLSPQSARTTRVRLDGGAGATVVWHPEADPAEAGVVGWDLLGGADSVIAADRIAEGLLSVVDDLESLPHRPEAELLCADLLVAAARGEHRLETVLRWIDARDLESAHRLLTDAGEEPPADDIDWFAYTSAAEQREVWQILTRALDPLRDPRVLARLQPASDSVRLPGALRTLFAGEPIQRPRELLVVAEPRTRGIAVALVDRLLWAAHEHGVRIDANPSGHDDAR